jgi:hypothetical protein
MTDEDRTAAKLRGFNCLIKFKDGEELLLKVAALDEEDTSDWFVDAERYLNSQDDVFPVYGISLARDTIKYIKEI